MRNANNTKQVKKLEEVNERFEKCSVANEIVERLVSEESCEEREELREYWSSKANNNIEVISDDLCFYWIKIIRKVNHSAVKASNPHSWVVSLLKLFVFVRQQQVC
jgi:hypothetical protein